MMKRALPAKIASQLYAAAELIADRGLEGTRMEEIAEATGIPKATLYYHLEGKNAVLEFLLEDFLDLIAGAVAVAKDADGSAAERLRASITAQLLIPGVGFTMISRRSPSELYGASLSVIVMLQSP